MAHQGSDDGVRAMMPFIRRADDVERSDPLVAYYTRMYALEQGMEKNADRVLLVKLLEKLEEQKKTLSLDSENDHIHIEEFAMGIFTRADKADRSGNTDLAKTAKAFAAASRFFEVCKRFGELPDNLKDKLKYSTWRATEIQKAKREGRTPDPPTPLEDTDPFIDSHTNANEQNDVTDEEAAAALDSALAAPPSEDLPPSPNHSVNYPQTSLPSVPSTGSQPETSYPNMPPSQPSSYTYDPGFSHSLHGQPQPPSQSMAAPAAIPPQAAVPPQAAIPPQAAMPPSATPQFGPSSTSGKVNPQTIVKAQKQARIAVSSLGFDDVDSAVKALKEALTLLGS